MCIIFIPKLIHIKIRTILGIDKKNKNRILIKCNAARNHTVLFSPLTTTLELFQTRIGKAIAADSCEHLLWCLNHGENLRYLDKVCSFITIYT